MITVTVVQPLVTTQVKLIINKLLQHQLQDTQQQLQDTSKQLLNKRILQEHIHNEQPLRLNRSKQLQKQQVNILEHIKLLVLQLIKQIIIQRKQLKVQL